MPAQNATDRPGDKPYGEPAERGDGPGQWIAADRKEQLAEYETFIGWR